MASTLQPLWSCTSCPPSVICGWLDDGLDLAVLLAAHERAKADGWKLPADPRKCAFRGWLERVARGTAVQETFEGWYTRVNDLRLIHELGVTGPFASLWNGKSLVVLRAATWICAEIGVDVSVLHYYRRYDDGRRCLEELHQIERAHRHLTYVTNGLHDQLAAWSRRWSQFMSVMPSAAEAQRDPPAQPEWYVDYRLKLRAIAPEVRQLKEQSLTVEDFRAAMHALWESAGLR